MIAVLTLIFGGVGYELLAIKQHWELITQGVRRLCHYPVIRYALIGAWAAGGVHFFVDSQD